jgi:hypothetical protein
MNLSPWLHFQSLAPITGPAWLIPFSYVILSVNHCYRLQIRHISAVKSKSLMLNFWVSWKKVIFVIIVQDKELSHCWLQKNWQKIQQYYYNIWPDLPALNYYYISHTVWLQEYIFSQDFVCGHNSRSTGLIL